MNESEWVSQWVSEWMNEWTNERTNERTNEWMNEWMNEWIWAKDGVSEWGIEWKWISEWMRANQWVDECVSDWKHEWINEWVCVNEWMNEWMNEWVSEWNPTVGNAQYSWPQIVIKECVQTLWHNRTHCWWHIHVQHVGATRWICDLQVYASLGTSYINLTIYLRLPINVWLILCLAWERFFLSALRESGSSFLPLHNTWIKNYHDSNRYTFIFPHNSRLNESNCFPGLQTFHIDGKWKTDLYFTNSLGQPLFPSFCFSPGVYLSYIGILLNLVNKRGRIQGPCCSEAELACYHRNKSMFVAGSPGDKCCCKPCIVFVSFCFSYAESYWLCGWGWGGGLFCCGWGWVAVFSVVVEGGWRSLWLMVE